MAGSTQQRRPFRRAVPSPPVKDHVVAGLFALILGPFGMHKFYLGYYQAGFTLMAFSIIGAALTGGVAVLFAWLFSIVEGICYFKVPQDVFEKRYLKKKRPWF